MKTARFLARFIKNNQEAYTRAGKNIITAARFSLKDGIHNGKWSLGSKREKFGH